MVDTSSSLCHQGLPEGKRVNLPFPMVFPWFSLFDKTRVVVIYFTEKIKEQIKSRQNMSNAGILRHVQTEFGPLDNIVWTELCLLHCLKAEISCTAEL